MKKFLFPIILICLCISCKDKVHETVQILIQNRTENSIQIALYPKAEYLAGSRLYYFSDNKGGATEKEFSLSPNWIGYYEWSEVIFESNELNIKPYTLAGKVFDSICINTVDINERIKFTHGNVIGYSDNMFSENSTWEYNIHEWSTHTRRNSEKKNYCYTFIISDDKIVVE